MLRLPDGMRNRIAEVARANKRSMNAEIVATLEAYYPPAPPLNDLIAAIEMTLNELKRNDSPRARRFLFADLEQLSEHLKMERGKPIGLPSDEP